MVEAVNAFGSGMAGLSVLCPPSHSTHVFHSSFSCTHPWSVHTHHDFGLLAPHAQALDDFGLTQAFSSSPRVAKRSGTCNSCPPDCCAFSRGEFPSHFSFSLTGISWVLPTSIFLCGLVNGVDESFPHGSNCGFCVDYYTRPGWESVNLFPAWFA